MPTPACLGKDVGHDWKVDPSLPPTSYPPRQKKVCTQCKAATDGDLISVTVAVTT